MFTESYYSTMAQILPILYFALVVEYRVLSPSTQGRMAARAKALYFYICTLALVLGEVACLNTLAHKSLYSSSTNTVIVMAAMILFAGFFAPISARFMDEQENFSKKWHGWVYWALAITLLVAAFILAAFLTSIR